MRALLETSITISTITTVCSLPPSSIGIHHSKSSSYSKVLKVTLTSICSNIAGSMPVEVSASAVLGTTGRTITLNDGTTLQTYIGDTFGTHFVRCDLCGKAITLTVHANTRPIEQHRGFKACKKLQEKTERERVRQEAQETARRLFPIPETASTASGSSSSVPAPVMTTGSPPPPTTPPLSPAAASPIPPPTLSTPTSTSCPANSGTHPPPLLQFRYYDPAGDEFSDGEWTSAESDAGRASPTPEPPKCEGCLVEYTAGNIWSDYPYQQHAHRKWPWEPIGWDGDFIRLRSTTCKRWADGPGGRSCEFCRKIVHTPQYKKFVERAKHAKPHTNWDYLTANQHVGLLKGMYADNRRLRTEVRNHIWHWRDDTE